MDVVRLEGVSGWSPGQGRGWVERASRNAAASFLGPILWGCVSGGIQWRLRS